ncbi:LysM peptidoglycan-binding domain-containing protein [Salirhabdus salicampi]|uniref:LysM peptidoglycan-binding domain-containing protein n=1 Tax=Salirhabdus salicampi TaxID=476102 RepID=UPI0020C51848|nr:LysM peptidoglycan-binding domain-containing protein [Salirhabdus salicampi]MCP8616293.1 LysM peptidoglycan-binding domain-containing protein [Salirhabdus salicampi]
MKKIYLSVTASTVLLTACAPQQGANPQEQQNTNNMNNQTEINEQINVQQTRQNGKNDVTNIEADEYFLEDIRAQYDQNQDNDNLKMIIDGIHVNTDPPAFIEGDEVYIPLTSVSTHFEAGVIYNDHSKTIGIHRGETDIDIAIEENTASINGEQVKAPEIITQEENVFVPVCFIAEALGYKVEKNIEADEVQIETHEPDTVTFGFDVVDQHFSQEAIPVQSSYQQTYTVQAGDSLSVIAKRFNTTVEQLRNLNNLQSDVIRVGQTLVISNRPNSYTVSSGDTLFSIARKFDMTVDEIKRLNNLPSNTIKIGQTLTLTPPQQYIIQSGDSLSVIAKRFNTTVEELRRLNNLTSDTIRVGQTLTISGNAGETNNQTNNTNTTQPQNSYTVEAGDTLSAIAKRFNTTVDEIKRLNNLTSDIIRVGQTLTISGQKQQETNIQNEQKTYTVQSGDNLTVIAKRFNTTVDQLKRINNLTSDFLRVGQTLIVSGDAGTTPQNEQPQQQESQPKTTQQGVTVSYKTHTVQSGDNLWNLSVKYGIPMLELAKENNLSINSSLSIGQKLRIPVYNVPVKSTVSSRHGELLDWWTEGRYVFPIGKEATITDFQTGRTFKVKHTMGGNHADAEPLTSTDTQRMKEIWGGSFSWTPRAIVISVDGRRLAAAMHSFPHSTWDIKNNNYDGHFCIHFQNSTRHKDGLVQDSMQRQVRIAAGVN